MAELTKLSYHFPEIQTAGGHQLLAVVEMFKGKSSNWVVSFQRHIWWCYACHAILHSLITGITCSITFSFQYCNFHTRNILNCALRSFAIEYFLRVRGDQY